MENSAAFDLKDLVYPVSAQQNEYWYRYLSECAAAIPTERPVMPISKHAEENRVLPAGDRYSGPLRLDRSPYLREIMDNMAPNSRVRHTIIMKGAQLGFTMALECIMCYYIGYSPADQLLVTASAELYRRWVGRRLEPAINSYGYREKIFAQERRGSGKQSGDKIATKEYIGGQLDLVSAQSAPSLRAMSKRILLRDEIDGSKEQLDTGEGSFLDVSMARTKAWGNRAKIIDVSTPTVAGVSAVEGLWEMGDQREFYVPCPHCGTFQVLKWRNFRPVIVQKVLQDVFYQCEKCGDEIFEHHKRVFLRKGEWRPKRPARKMMTRSYHIPSWYAPLGISPWVQIYDTYQQAQGNADKIKSFWNLEGGLPSKDLGARRKPEKVMENAGTYKRGTVPDGVLFLTMFVDVQQGTANDPNNPPRLEAEICGHGIRWRTWSIDYLRFEGQDHGGGVQDPFSGAWAEMDQWAKETELTFERADGKKFPVEMVFIDSGDGTMTDVVYRFCGRWRGTYPTSGFGGKQLKQRKGEKGDEMTSSNFKRYRAVRVGELTLVQISTNYYKTNLYNNLGVKRLDYDPQSPGFCDFPVNYTAKYYRMLTAEEKRRDGSFHAGGRRNESLDCRVGNMCACDFHLDNIVDALREAFKKDYHPDELRFRINVDYALQYLAKRAGVDYDLYAAVKSLKKTG